MSMIKHPKQVRRSVTLPAETDTKVQRMARRENRSAAQVLENLIEAGLRAKEAEKRRFFEVADRLQNATDAAEVRQLKIELARMTFGS
jgi:predicted DNA-binding protein